MRNIIEHNEITWVDIQDPTKEDTEYLRETFHLQAKRCPENSEYQQTFRHKLRPKTCQQGNRYKTEAGALYPGSL